jgi:hypothetical protein
MLTTAEILASYRDAMKRRFLAVVRRRPVVPRTLVVPADPQAALRLGLKLGRSSGYGEGLVDGTKLGLDVGLESVDAMLCQPVIFGQGGVG